ncbi:MAG: hypothetical protein ACLUGH_08925 [Oscillospiraceae bacterium]
MIAAIITYLIIGGIIVRWLNRTLSDIVREETLIMKIVYYAYMIIIAPVLFMYGIAKGAYQELKERKSES